MRTNIMQAKRKSIEEIKAMASARRAFTAYQFKQEASRVFIVGKDCHVDDPGITKAETILILTIIAMSAVIIYVLNSGVLK